MDAQQTPKKKSKKRKPASNDTPTLKDTPTPKKLKSSVKKDSRSKKKVKKEKKDKRSKKDKKSKSKKSKKTEKSNGTKLLDNIVLHKKVNQKEAHLIVKKKMLGTSPYRSSQARNIGFQEFESKVSSDEETVEVSESSSTELEEKDSPEKSLMSDFRIPSDIVERLKKDEITEMFEIQKQCFDHIFDGKDLVGRAHTGEGKTLAFVLPILSKLRESQISLRRGRNIRVLALCPVRELAMQVGRVFDDLSFELQTLCIYGGTGYGPQLSVLRNGCDIVVGTVGRVKDLIDKNHLNLSSVEFAVLDEADEMLNIGFSEDVEYILNQIKTSNENSVVQTALFSATLPEWVYNIIDKYLKPDKALIDLVGNKKRKVGENIEHMAICCHWGERAVVMGDLLLVYAGPNDRVIIFAEKKVEVNEIALNSNIKRECQVLHGDIPQKQREVTIKGFREGKFPILVATDVAARGLDISGVTLIIQCEPSKDAENYIHRSGRTGRAGKQGKAICFYTPKQIDRINSLERKAGVKFARIGAPQLKDLVKSTATDSVKSLKNISEEVIDCFKHEAKELISNVGAENAVSAALAAISGYTEVSQRRSLLTCSPSQVTMIATLNAKEKNYQSMNFHKMSAVLQNAFGQRFRAMRNLTLTSDRNSCVFDIPVHMVPHVKTSPDSTENGDSYSQRNNNSANVKIEVCEKLPDLLTLNVTNTSSGWNQNGRSGGGYNNRNGYNSSRNGRYQSGNSGRNFSSRGGRNFGNNNSRGGGGWNSNRSYNGSSGGGQRKRSFNSMNGSQRNSRGGRGWQKRSY